MDNYTCPDCGHYRDTPIHKLGCQGMARSDARKAHEAAESRCSRCGAAEWYDWARQCGGCTAVGAGGEDA